MDGNDTAASSHAQSDTGNSRENAHLYLCPLSQGWPGPALPLPEKEVRGSNER